MPINFVDDFISITDLRTLAKERFGDMVKAVVDINREVMAVGAELHSDEEALLLEKGSNQHDLWGINIYIDQPQENWIEFDSMINLRPSQGNFSRTVENPELQEKIKKIVKKLVKS